MSKSLRFLLSALFILAAALTRAATPAPSAEEAKPLPVGAKAPGLTLTDLHGAQVGLAATFAAQPTVLVFYRGSWCPYCNAQLAALRLAPSPIFRVEQCSGRPCATALYILLPHELVSASL